MVKGNNKMTDNYYVYMRNIATQAIIAKSGPFTFAKANEVLDNYYVTEPRCSSPTVTDPAVRIFVAKSELGEPWGEAFNGWETDTENAYDKRYRK
jgi:hypothetical protein